MSLHTLIFLPPTTTWWAFVVGVLVWAGACNAVGIGGGCHDSRTGEVLKEVEDANGKVWPVKKHPQTLKFAGQELVFCAVSIEAATEMKGSMLVTHYVFHPETGSPIKAGGTGGKGMRRLDGYEWY